MTEDLRLLVLRLLDQAQGYDQNALVLRRLLAEFGHNASADKLRAELDWLAEAGLVTVREAGSTVVAMLTQRGADVAKGSSLVTGVARPEPE